VSFSRLRGNDGERVFFPGNRILKAFFSTYRTGYKKKWKETGNILFLLVVTILNCLIKNAYHNVVPILHIFVVHGNMDKHLVVLIALSVPATP
jgi:hypothetical protein